MAIEIAIQIQSSRLPFAPFQLRPQHFEVAARRRPDQPQRRSARQIADLVAGLQLESRLAVEGHEHLVALLHVRLHADRPTSPGMTIGRLVSVCGAIGVRTSASTLGCTIGPPAARL